MSLDVLGSVLGLGMSRDKGDEGYGWVWASVRVKDCSSVSQAFGSGLKL